MLIVFLDGAQQPTPSPQYGGQYLVPNTQYLGSQQPSPQFAGQPPQVPPPPVPPPLVDTFTQPVFGSGNSSSVFLNTQYYNHSQFFAQPQHYSQSQQYASVLQQPMYQMQQQTVQLQQHFQKSLQNQFPQTVVGFQGPLETVVDNQASSSSSSGIVQVGQLIQIDDNTVDTVGDSSSRCASDSKLSTLSSVTEDVFKCPVASKVRSADSQKVGCMFYEMNRFTFSKMLFILFLIKFCIYFKYYNLLVKGSGIAWV